MAAALMAGTLVATLGATTSQAAPADFPSWTDVQAAKRDEAAAKAQLASLNAAITAAQAEVDRTQKEAELRGTEYAQAQQAYDEQVIVTMRRGFLFVSSISDGSCLGVVSQRGCDIGLVGYQTTLLVERAGAVLTPDLVAELKQEMLVS